MKLQVGIYIPKSEVSLVNFHSIYVVLVCLFFWLICCQLNLSSWWCCTRNNMTKNLIQFWRIKVREKIEYLDKFITYFKARNNRELRYGPQGIFFCIFLRKSNAISLQTLFWRTKKKILLLKSCQLKNNLHGDIHHSMHIQRFTQHYYYLSSCAHITSYNFNIY